MEGGEWEVIAEVEGRSEQSAGGESESPIHGRGGWHISYQSTSDRSTVKLVESIRCGTDRNILLSFSHRVCFDSSRNLFLYL